MANNHYYSSEEERINKEQSIRDMHYDVMRRLYTRYGQDPIRYNTSDLNDLRKRMSIALANWGAYKSVITSAQSSHFLLGQNSLRDDVSPRRKKERKVHQQKVAKFYEAVQYHLFDATLGNKTLESTKYSIKAENVIDKFTYQRVNNNQIFQSYDSMINAWNKVQATGEALYFDLETFGDKASISEFNFRHIKKQGQTWNVEQDSTVYKSIIGINDKEYDEAKKLLERYRVGGDKGLTKEDMVTLKRYALTGHKNTVIGDIDKTRGRVNFKSFAGPNDIKAMSYGDIARGIERYHDIHKELSKIKLQYSFGGKTYNVVGWEKEFLEGLTAAFNRGENSAVLMGHNISGFDIPRLATFAESGKLSSEGYKALMHLTGGEISSPRGGVYDSLAVARAAEATNRGDFYMIDDGSGNKISIFKKIYEEKGFHDNLSFNQQEALAWKYFYQEEGGYLRKDGTKLNAHMADTDTLIGARIVLESDFNKDANIAGIKRAAEHKINKNQIFMATEGIDLKRYGLFGFRTDNLAGDYRTIDGFAINKKNAGENTVRKEITDQWLFKKNGLYQIDNLIKLSETEDFRENIGGISPELKKAGQYALTFKIYSDDDTVKKSSKGVSTYTVVGTKDKIQSLLNAGFLHTFDVDDTGNIINGSLTDQAKEDLRIIRPGATSSAKDFEEITEKKIVENSDFTFKNDSAARNSREHKFKMDTGLLSFIDDAEASGDFEAYKQKVIDNTKKIYEFINDNPDGKLVYDTNLQTNVIKNLEEKDIRESIFGYVGFNEELKDGSYRKKLLTETYDTFLNRIDEVLNNKELIRASVNAARQRSGLNEINIDTTSILTSQEGTQYFNGTIGTEKTNFIYGTNHYMTSVPSIGDYAVELESKKSETRKVKAYYDEYSSLLEAAAEYKAHTNNEIDPRKDFRGTYAYTQNNFYVNLKGFDGLSGIDTEKGFNVKLNSTGGGLADSLFRAVGKDPSKMEYADRIAEIKKFALILAKQGIIDPANSSLINGKKVNINAGEESPESAAKKIFDYLKANREEYNKRLLAGDFFTDDELVKYGINPDERPNVISILNRKKNLGLTDHEIKTYIEKGNKNIQEIKVMQEGGIESLAHQFTKDVLFNGIDSNFLEKDLERFGYSDKVKERLINAWKIRNEDTKKFMTELFTGIYKSGGSISYDEESKQLKVSHGRDGSYLLKNLPIDVYENGRFYTKIGNTKTANMIGWYNTGYGNDVKIEFGSRTKKAAAAVKSSIKYRLNEANWNGGYFDELDRIMSKFGQTLRETSSADKPDAQDLKTQFMFDYEDLVKNLNDGDLDNLESKIANSKTMSQEQKDSTLKVLRKLRRTPNKERHNLHEMLIINQNLPEIFATRSDDLLKMGLTPEEIQIGHSHLESFIALFASGNDFLEDANPEKRKINAQLARALKFNADSASIHLMDESLLNAEEKKELNAIRQISVQKYSDKATEKRRLLADFAERMNSKYLDVQYGQYVQTRSRRNEASNNALLREDLHTAAGNDHIYDRGYRKNYDKYLTNRVETNVRLNRMSISTEDLHTLISESDYLKNPKLNKVKNMLASSHMDEGSALMDPRLIDRMFSQRKSDQSINFNRVKEFTDFGEIIDQKTKELADFNIIINEDGDINFKYNEGFHVDKGDVFLHSKGMDGAATPVTAKYEGIVKLEIFTSDGRKAEDYEITQLLREEMEKTIKDRFVHKKKKNIVKQDIDQAKEEAIRVLDKHGFEFKYYVHNVEQGVNPKMADEAEKGMYRGAYMGLGSTNKKIQKILDKNNLYFLEDRVLSIDVLDELKNIKSLSAFKKSQFAKIALHANEDTRKALAKINQESEEIKKKFNDGKISIAEYSKANQARDKKVKEIQKKYLYNLYESIENSFGTGIKYTNNNWKPKGNVTGMSKFVSQAMNERYLAWDSLKHVFVDNNIADSLKEANKIHVLDQHYHDEEGHKDVKSNALRTINNYVDQETKKEWNNFQKSSEYKQLKDPKERAKRYREINENVAKRILDIFGKEREYVDIAVDNKTKKAAAIEGLSLNQTKDGLEISDNNWKLNSTVYQNIIEGKYKSEGVPELKKYETNPANRKKANIKFNIAKSDMYNLPDYDLGRIYEEGNALNKGIKISNRSIAVLEADRQTEYRRKKTEEALRNVYGAKGEQVIQKYVNSTTDGEVLGSKLIDMFKEKTFMRAEDKKNPKLNISWDFKNDAWRFSADKHNRILEEFEKIGIGQDKKDRIKILDAILESSIGMYDLYDKNNQVIRHIQAPKIGFSVIRDRYSAMSHLNARNFNNLAHDEASATEYANKHGLKIIKLEDLASPRSSKQVENFINNMDGKEFILDLHMDATGSLQAYDTSTQEGRFIHMPWKKSSIMGEDGVSHSNSQKDISYAHRLLNEIITANMNDRDDVTSMSDDRKENMVNLIKEKIQSARDSISREASSKDSVFMDLTKAELQDSGMFTAYGHSFKNLTEKDGALTKMQTVGGLKLIDAERSMQNAEKALAKAKSQKAGAEVIKAAAEKTTQQLAFDYTILSKQAMNQYYLSDGFFERLGLDAKTEKQLRQAFKTDVNKYFEAGNTTLGLTNREPQGYFKSTAVHAISFSSAVQGDTAEVGFIGQKAKKGDFDSDKVATALLKAEARLTDNSGKTKIVEVDLAAFNLLSQQAGKAIKGIEWTEEGKARMQSIKEKHIADANYNTLWALKEEKVRDMMADYSMGGSDSVSKGLSQYTLEGKVGGTFVGRLYIDSNEAEKLRSKYEDIEQQTISHFKNSNPNYFEQNALGDFYRVESEGRITNVEGHKQRAAIVDAFNEGGIQGYSLDEVKKALHYKLSEDIKTIDSLAFTLRKGAGEMNYNIFGYLKMAEMSSAVDAEQMANIMHAHIALGEAFLTPKKQIGFEGDSITKFSEALNKAYRAMSTNSGREEAQEELYQVTKNILQDRLTKEGDKSNYVFKQTMLRAGLGNGENPLSLSEKNVLHAEAEKALDQWARDYSSLVSNVDMRGFNKNMLDFGLTRGVSEEQALKIIENSNEPIQQNLASLNKQAIALDYAPLGKLNQGPRPLIGDGGPELSSGTDLNFSDEALQRIMKQRPKISGMRGIPGAVIGIAAGLLTAGIANDPTERTQLPPGANMNPMPSGSVPMPADTQAMGAIQEQEGQYGPSMLNMPSFSDSNINTMRSGTNKGYVINIAANSSQQQSQINNSIQAAIQSSVPKTTSMNVSMNTSYRDQLSSFQLDRMIANSFS